MADGIAASAGGAYENAGYSVGEKLTQGITRHISSYTPPPIKVPVVYSSTSTDSNSGGGGVYSSDPLNPWKIDAIGENRVPRDNTLYLLHEGERVLTAREARAQDQGGTGGVNIYMGGNYTVRQDSDIAAIAEAVAARILAARRIVRT